MGTVGIGEEVLSKALAWLAGVDRPTASGIWPDAGVVGDGKNAGCGFVNELAYRCVIATLLCPSNFAVSWIWV